METTETAIERELDSTLRWIDQLRRGETRYAGAALETALQHAFEHQAQLLAYRRHVAGAQ